MGYPENVLARDEQVVLHRHPHWGRLLVPALVLILASAAAAFISGYVNTLTWEPSAKRIVFLVIAGLLIEWIDTVKDADPRVRAAAVSATETAVA